jgi:hypothetical protein
VALWAQYTSGDKTVNMVIPSISKALRKLLLGLCLQVGTAIAVISRVAVEIVVIIASSFGPGGYAVKDIEPMATIMALIVKE